MKKLLYITLNNLPFQQTFKLSNFIFNLSKEVNHNDFEVRVILPYSQTMNEHVIKMDIKAMEHSMYCLKKDNITYYFVEQEFFVNSNMKIEEKEIEAYAIFSKIALDFIATIDYKPDIIHIADWKTGFVPLYYKTIYDKKEFYKDIKIIYTITNLKAQGIFELNMIQELTGLPHDIFTLNHLTTWGRVNILKCGIHFSDIITTTSPTYAKEITTPFYSEGIDNAFIRKKNDLVGILHGIDYHEYNPFTDPYIYHNYDNESFIEGKKINKLNFQNELGLNIDESCFLIGLHCQLIEHKGMDLIDPILNDLLNKNIQLVVLGTGEAKYEYLFRYYQRKFIGRVEAIISTDNVLAHKLYAACDSLLLPSLLEPCGKTHLIGLRYGTVPIVRETGCYKDTIESYHMFDQSGTGFTFRSYNAHELLTTIRFAYNVFQNEKMEWNNLIKRGMNKNFSFAMTVNYYELLYKNGLEYQEVNSI